MGIVDITA